MELADRFEKMITYCDEVTLPPYARERLKSHLNYFRTQALCDVDRREPTSSLHWNWQSFKMQRNAVDVIAHFAAEPGFWRPVAEFVTDVASDDAIEKRNEEPESVSAFFVRLIRDVHQASLGHEPVEKAFAILGLKYLRLESLRSPRERDASYIRKIWRAVWRTLDREGFLAKYRGNETLTKELKAFVANRDVRRPPKATPVSPPPPVPLPTELKPFQAPFRGKLRIGDPDHDYSGKQGINPRDVGDAPS